MRLSRSWKVFGAAFDPSDHPEKVALQRAYLCARARGHLETDHPLDPYDLILDHRASFPASARLVPIGRFDVPSWLSPRPSLSDLELLEPGRFSRFIDSDGCRGVAGRLKSFVATQVLPDRPLMLGVDHCLTGGVLEALAELVGPDAYSLLVLDSHFDGVPLPVRRLAAEQFTLQGRGPSVDTDTGRPRPATPRAGAAGPHAGVYTCGTFLDCLFEEGTLLPRHTIVAGVTDCGFDRDEGSLSSGERLYRDCCEDFRDRGVTFIPGGPGPEGRDFVRSLDEALAGVRTPWLYVSVDADVGAGDSVYAVRFFERLGIPPGVLVSAVDRLAAHVRSGDFLLAGLDIMEIDVHRAGLKPPGGRQDRTARFLADLAARLLAADSEKERPHA